LSNTPANGGKYAVTLGGRFVAPSTDISGDHSCSVPFALLHPPRGHEEPIASSG